MLAAAAVELAQQEAYPLLRKQEKVEMGYLFLGSHQMLNHFFHWGKCRFQVLKFFLQAAVAEVQMPQAQQALVEKAVVLRDLLMRPVQMEQLTLAAAVVAVA
jgi:hypothetical protein